jgi:hypothetical protein
MTALGALYQALQIYLPGDPLVDDRVYPDEAPAGAAKPYWIYFFVSGGESNEIRRRQDAQFVVTVKCVALTMSQSLAGAGQIEAKLNDAGYQDGAASPVPGVDGWQVLTVTQDRVVHVIEPFEGAQPIYHDGHQYIVVMEKT